MGNPGGNDNAEELDMKDQNDESQSPIASSEALPQNLQSGLALPDHVLPPNLFVLPLSNQTVYPSLMAPLHITIPKFIATVEEAVNRQRIVGLLLTKTSEAVENIEAKDLQSVGVAVKILKRIKMPDGSINLLVHAVKRFKAKRPLSNHPYLVVEAEYLEDIIEKSDELDALLRATINSVKRFSELNPFFTDEMKVAILNAPNPGAIADLVSFALNLSKEDSQTLLETLSVKERFKKLLVFLQKEHNLADLQRKISDEVNTKLNKMQREFFLKEQLKSIKKELGLEEDGKEKSTRTFRERIEAAGMPDEVKTAALEEVGKFETLSEQSPEYNVSRNYLETICSLPWSVSSLDNLDLHHARTVFDEDHFGLEKVKERIIEFLAVRKLKKNPKGSIICLVGPPGVGKTSIGKSIARAMDRKFHRFSLGGMRDEAEIKGHRRTYVGALPGKLIQALKRTGTKNPVLMLDEIDKLGQSFQGDPASALLEALDPEQNHNFVDHYLDLPFDLSQVVFIATANSLNSIPPPLLDRMEVIEISGYTLEEKEIIAEKYLLPKEFEANGISKSQLKISKAAIRLIINDYAREPGLRNLQKWFGKIARKAATKTVFRTENALLKKKENIDTSVMKISAEDVQKWIGPKIFYNEALERITEPGVVVGLAWTSMGGDILFIEASEIPGTGQLKLTGQMGEVMTESATIAWSYVKKKLFAEKLIDQDFLKHKDIHLHIPAGAIPKDGPSAGVTMATALYSLLSNRIANPKVAMTGELSLIGKALPVGGIKEKVLAARRAGLTTIILPKMNEKDFAELPSYATKGMQFHFVGRVEEVFDIALVNQKQNSKSIYKKPNKILKKKK